MITHIPFAGVALFGVACIFLSWRHKTKTKGIVRYLHPMLLPLGWGALVLLNYLLVQEYGTEVGLAYGLTLPSLIALVFLYFNRDEREKRQPNSNAKMAAEESKPQSSGSWLNNSSLLFLTVFYSGIVSLLVGVFFGQMFPLHEVDQMMVAVVVSLLAWPLLAYWFVATIVRMKVFIGTLIFTVINAAYLFL